MLPGTATKIATVMAGAFAAAVVFGSLTGAAIPTTMKTASSTSDWRERYGSKVSGDDYAYYVEAGPQDLSPPATEGSQVWPAAYVTDPQETAGTYPAGYAEDYALADDRLSAAFDEALPGDVEHDPQPGQVSGPAGSAEQEAQQAQQVANAVLAAEAS